MKGKQVIEVFEFMGFKKNFKKVNDKNETLLLFEANGCSEKVIFAGYEAFNLGLKTDSEDNILIVFLDSRAPDEIITDKSVREHIVRYWSESI